MKQVWKRLTAVLLMLAMLLPMMGMAEEAAAVYGVCLGGSDGGTVKVRKQAAGNSVWFQIPKGHVAEILGEVTKDGVDWYKINTAHPTPNGRMYIGYIMQEYFRPLTSAEQEEYLGTGAAPDDPEADLPEDEEDEEFVEYTGKEVTGAVGKTNARVNFRSQPTTKSGEILCEIPKDTEVEINAIPLEGDGWYRVRYNGQTGYIYSDLLDVIEEGEVTEDELTGAVGEVTADGVRLREEPNTSSTVLAELEEGAAVELLTIPDVISENNWYKVRWNGQVGYIQSNYIRVTDEGDKDEPVIIAMGVTVNTNGVNFRKGPGKNFTSMGKLPSGIEVEIIEIPEKTGEEYWYFVRYKGDLGYIQSPYIKVLGQDEPSEPDAPEVTMSTGVTTSTSGVYFRTGPGKKYSSYGKIPLDSVVELLSFPEMIDEDHWYKARYNNRVGYIMSTFIRVLSVREEDLPAEEKYGYAKLIKDTKVNLRNAPGGDIVTQWSGRGSLMRLTGKASPNGLYNWYPVYHVKLATILYVREDMIEVVNVKDGEIVAPDPEPESPYGYVITTAAGVNLRIKPAEDYIVQIPRNTVLTCVGPTQDAMMGGVNYTWYEVRYNGMTGWVRGDKVRVCTSTGGEIVDDEDPSPETPEKPEDSITIRGYIRITGNRVALRTAPGGEVKTRIDTGTVLPVMGETEDKGFYFWYPVRDASDRFGWIRGDCAVPCDANGNDLGSDDPVTPPEEEEPELVGATARITTNTNFREEADASDKENIICVIPMDAVVTVLRIPENTETGWYKISYNGETGYVYGKYVEMITEGGEEGEQPAPSAYGYIMITGNRVAVRLTPGGSELTRVATGTVWPLIGESKEKDGVEWFYAEAGGEKGYVHSGYAFKLSPTQEESYLAGNGVPEETPVVPDDSPSGFLVVVNTNGLNIRESASQDSQSYGKVTSGTVMQFFTTKRVGSVDWYCVLYDHQERWVHGNYVEELTVAEYNALVEADPSLAPDEAAYLGYVRTNQDNVYIRNAADGSTYIELVKTKSTVMRYYSDMISAGGKGWYRVLSPKDEWGYIRTDLITKCDENGDDLPVELPDIGDTTSAPEMQQESKYTTLRLGDGPSNSKGTNVKLLVQELINQGYYKGALTDTYTSDVMAAVKAFQTVNDLDVDGVAGSATHHALFGTVPIGAGNTKNMDFTIYPVEKIDWFTGGIQDLLPRGANFKIYDVKTGIVWWAHRWSGGSHADIETLTKADSERLCQIYGVKNLQEIVEENMYERRPCLLTIGTRTFACSLDGMQHNPAGDTISNNGMDGQVCLHFTNSKGHASGVVSDTHAAAIEYAYKNCPAGQKK
nr:SH3 domain-containing protein [Clostridia bacterium]